MKLFTRIALVVAGCALFVSGDAQASVSKSQRDLVVFISLTKGFEGPYKAFYEFVEFGAESLAKSYLTSKYRAIHVVKGSASTRANLTTTLRNVTGNSAVQAVDLIMVTHGLGSNLYFWDTNASAATIANDIRASLSSGRRAKLRAVFSSACFGSQHISSWLYAGFKVASGSRQIYADSALSYVPFLACWAAGNTFATGISAANAADPLRVQDGIAKQVLFLCGYSNWYQVDSYRLTGGNTAIRITSNP